MTKPNRCAQCDNIRDDGCPYTEVRIWSRTDVPQGRVVFYGSFHPSCLAEWMKEKGFHDDTTDPVG